MFELIQYAPQTDQVRSVPLLIVPPVINKYYVIDLAPGRSLIEYLVGEGQEVFVISWRNPDARLRALARERGWEIRDFRTARKAARIGVPSALALGAAGGALAALASRRQSR